jgi:hypothetical protein
VSSVLDRLAALEAKCSGKCPYHCIVKDLIEELGIQNDSLMLIFGDGYVSKLRELENRQLLILKKINEVIHHVNQN